jgi:hypothetical protein
MTEQVQQQTLFLSLIYQFMHDSAIILSGVDACTSDSKVSTNVADPVGYGHFFLSDRDIGDRIWIFGNKNSQVSPINFLLHSDFRIIYIWAFLLFNIVPGIWHKMYSVEPGSGFAVLVIRIRSDPGLFAGSGSGNFSPEPDPTPPP